MTPHLLVVAKAPVPGRVKTRLGAEVGMEAAAELAAASLVDTLMACAATYGPQRCCLALDGTLASATRGDALSELLDGWTVFPQRGEGLGARLVNAHADAGARVGGAVVQVGMDTPQITPPLLAGVGDALRSSEAVLGPADDGGWWVLGVRDPSVVAAIRDVPMSAPTTGTDTCRALESAGVQVTLTVTLRDVDTVSDAAHVAALFPDSAFARAWNALARNMRSAKPGGQQQTPRS